MTKRIGPLIVGISGKKRHGKNEVARLMSKHFAPGECDAMAFADALKAEVARACDVSEGFIDFHKEDFRPILQWWGTDFRRKFCDDDYWVQQLAACIPETNLSGGLIFITDVRFKNEHAFVKSRGGIMIRVNRPGLASNDPHPSENDLDDAEFDFTITNGGTLQDLEVAAAAIAENIKQLI